MKYAEIAENSRVGALKSTREPYSLPDLGYAYDALEPGYSSEILEIHYSKHHQAYVDGANKTSLAIAKARDDNNFETIKQLQADLAFNVSGHVLHSLFWRNIAPHGSDGPPDSLALSIAESFGSLDALREHFLAAGTSIQGSGWASLSWEPVRGGLIVEQIHDHQASYCSGSQPILVVDMWEHAFYLQFRNEKQKWARAFWELINWDDVNTRFMRAQNVTFLAAETA